MDKATDSGGGNQANNPEQNQYDSKGIEHDVLQGVQGWHGLARAIRSIPDGFCFMGGCFMDGESPRMPAVRAA